MITKKILDFDYQLNRIFGTSLNEDDYVTKDRANGKYDIIFCHREGISDSLSELLEFCDENSTIIVDVTTESGNLQEFLDKFYIITNELNYKFYLVVDSDISNYLNKNKVNYTTISSFEFVFHAFLNEKSDSLINVNKNIESYDNGFMSLNNSCRIHRVFLLTQLLKRNLDISKSSFLFTTGGELGSMYNEDIFNEMITKLYDSKFIDDTDIHRLKNIQLPKILDYDVTKPTYIYNDITEYYSSIINLVTENVMGMTNGDISPYGLITFTEKIIKPFVSKQIPLFIALPGLQTELRRLGFDLFDDIIDTSYESVMDATIRINLILDQLEILLKMDLVEFKNKNSHRFQHNYELLYKLAKSGESKIQSFLYDTILK